MCFQSPLFYLFNPSRLRLALMVVLFNFNSNKWFNSIDSIHWLLISSTVGVGCQTVSCVSVCACLWPSENQIVYKYLYIKSYIYVIETLLHHFRSMLILQIKILRKEQHILVCTIFLMHLYHDTIYCRGLSIRKLLLFGYWLGISHPTRKLVALIP